MANQFSGPVISDKIVQLFGEKYDLFMVYDFQKKAWNHSKYMGYKIPFQEEDTVAVWQMKNSLESNPLIKGRKLVASATTIIDASQYDWVSQMVKNPEPDTYGTCAVGNIITFDPKTETLYGPGDEWMYVLNVSENFDAAINAANRFATIAARRMCYQNELLRMHVKK